MEEKREENEIIPRVYKDISGVIKYERGINGRGWLMDIESRTHEIITPVVGEILTDGSLSDDERVGRIKGIHYEVLSELLEINKNELQESNGKSKKAYLFTLSYLLSSYMVFASEEEMQEIFGRFLEVSGLDEYTSEEWREIYGDSLYLPLTFIKRTLDFTDNGTPRIGPWRIKNRRDSYKSGEINFDNDILWFTFLKQQILSNAQSLYIKYGEILREHEHDVSSTLFLDNYIEYMQEFGYWVISDINDNELKELFSNHLKSPQFRIFETELSPATIINRLLRKLAAPPIGYEIFGGDPAISNTEIDGIYIKGEVQSVQGAEKVIAETVKNSYDMYYNPEQTEQKSEKVIQLYRLLRSRLWGDKEMDIKDPNPDDARNFVKLFLMAQEGKEIQSEGEVGRFIKNSMRPRYGKLDNAPIERVVDALDLYIKYVMEQEGRIYYNYEFGDIMKYLLFPARGKRQEIFRKFLDLCEEDD
jgi:hypothetical protein